MARKQKRLTRKQHNQERRVMASRQRQVEDAISPEELSPQQLQLGLDIAPLTVMIEELSGSKQMGKLRDILIDTADLAREPELAEFFFPQSECIQVMTGSDLEWGISTEALAALPKEEQIVKQFEMVIAAGGLLLSDEHRQEILMALEQLRQRFRQAGEQTQTARAAALQSFLSDPNVRDLWPRVGLIREIAIRSLNSGLEKVMTTLELKGLTLPDLDDSPQILEEIISDTPPLGKYSKRQGDELWDEGLLAFYYGDLYLDLFTMQEVKNAILLLYIKDGGVPTSMAGIQPITELSDERRLLFIDQLNDYLSEILTPDRLEQLRARLQTLCQEDADYPPQYANFVRRAAGYMAEPEAVELEKRFLICALLGEIRINFHPGDEEEDE